MSAPIIDDFKKSQLELYEWFTIRHCCNSDQQFMLTTSEDGFRAVILARGLPVFFDHPGPICQNGDSTIPPKHIRVRPGFVIHQKRKVGVRIGYDLAFDTVIAYDDHHQVCWRSAPITKIAFIIVAD